MANGKKRAGDSTDNANQPEDKKRKADYTTLVLPTPQKSPSDTKQYRAILLPNGLVALLISDTVEDVNPHWSQSSFYSPENYSDTDIYLGSKYAVDSWHEEQTNCRKFDLEMHQYRSPLSRAAISVAVKAGSVHDPQNNMGMAHLLEHMTFNGSKKYPQEDYIKKFIHYHGATSNAYTEQERTVYYFALSPDQLDHGMDILQDMLLRPSLDEKCVCREMQNIESEFLMKRPSKWLKAFEIVKMTMTDGHPMGYFNWGTVKTLKSEIKEALTQFHGKHYTANNMVLAVQSPASLDYLQTLVESHWASADNDEVPKKVGDMDHSINPYDPLKFSKLYKIPSVVDEIFILWHVEPEAWRNTEEKPMKLLSYILTDAREGSLIDFLLQKKWATSIEAGDFPPSRKNHLSNYHSLFYLNISLLDDGVENLEKVVQSVYDYLSIFLHEDAMGKKAELWLEMKSVRQSMFDHQGCGIPLETTANAAVALLERPCSTGNIFTRHLITTEYKNDLFQKYADDIFMHPENALYMQFANPTKMGHTQAILNHCESAYSVEDIPSSFSCQVEYPELRLEDIKTNRFLSTNFTVYPPVKQFYMDNSQISLKYSNDLTLPRTLWKFTFISGMKDFRSSQLIGIWTCYMQMKLNPTISNAAKAGVVINILYNTTRTIIYVFIGGFPQHIPYFFASICSQILFTTEISDTHYECAKQCQLRGYNHLSSNNFSLFRQCIHSILTLDTPNEIFNSCQFNSLTKADLETCISLFRKQVYVAGSITGNTSLNEAIQCKYYLNELIVRSKCEAIPHILLKKLVKKSPLLLLPSSRELCCRFKNLANPADDNNYLLNVYQLARQSQENIKFCQILIALIAPHAFNILRTQQNLGYAVFISGPDPESKRAEFSVLIVSPSRKFSICDVSNKVDDFFQHFYQQQLNKMEEKDFSDFMDDFLKRPCSRNIISKEVTLTSLKKWYKNKIVNCLPANNDGEFYGLSKLSIQLLGNPNEKCKKNLQCKNSGWKVPQGGNPDLQFGAPCAVCEGRSSERSGQKYFIWNVKEFHSNTAHTK